MSDFCGGLQDRVGAYFSSGGKINECAEEHVILPSDNNNETSNSNTVGNNETGYSGGVGNMDSGSSYVAIKKVPFSRSADLSSYWKKHGNAIEMAIWTTVSSCQYDDLKKKERLYLAVSDALSGKRTIKAASAHHTIPFTTVQTYFHRARQAASNALLELDKRRDMELPKQIEIPVLLTSKYNDNTSAEGVWNIDESADKNDVISKTKSDSSNINVDSNDTRLNMNVEKRSAKLNEVLLNLKAKMKLQREHNSVCSSSTENNTSGITGSSSMKRKPKSIRRLIINELMNDQRKEMPKADENKNDSDNNEDGGIGREGEDIENAGRGLNEQICGGSFMDESDDDNDRMEDSDDIHYEDIDLSEQSDESDENFDDVVTNWHRSVAERSVEGSDVSSATKKRLVRAILYVWTRQMTSEEACVHYCLDEEYFEKYFEHFNEFLRTLTRPLCSGDSKNENGTDGVNENDNRLIMDDGDKNIDGSVINSDKDLDRDGNKINGNRDGNNKSCDGNDKMGDNTTDDSDSNDIDAINMQIEEVYRKSHYSAEQKLRLHEAILMVLRGERTVNGAANMMQLPASTLHPYVQKARLAIGDCSALLSKTMSLNDNNDSSNKNGNITQKGLQFDWSDIAQLSGRVKEFLDEIPFEEQTKGKLQTAILMGTTHSYQGGFGISDDKASDEEVRCIVLKLLANCSTRNRRRDQLISAVTKAVSGRFTIKDASQMEGLPVSTVHPYVSKARHMLGTRCPAPKGTTTEVEQPISLNRLQWCAEVDKFGGIGIGDSAGVSNIEEGNGIVKETRKLLRKRHLSSPSRSTSSSTSSSCDGNSLQTYEDELMMYRNMNAMNLHENIAKNVKEVRIKYLIYLLVLRQYRRSFREQVLLSKALAHVLLDGLLVEEVAETNLGLSMYILKAYVKRCREVNHCIMHEFPVFRSGVRALHIERHKNPNLFHAPPEFDESVICSLRERRIAKAKYDAVKREWLGTVLNGHVAEPMASYLQKLWAVNFPVGADLVQGLAQYTFRSVYPEMNIESDVWLNWVRDYCDEHGYLADSDI